jgi:hypothetical protein
VLGLTTRFKPMADRRGLYAPTAGGVASAGNVVTLGAPQASVAGR